MALVGMVPFDLIAEAEADAYHPVKNVGSNGCAAVEAKVGNISPRTGPANGENSWRD